jgi:hypothetical protein
VKGSLFIRFQVYRSADAERGVSFTHNYNSDGMALEFDSDKGARVNNKERGKIKFLKTTKKGW